MTLPLRLIRRVLVLLVALCAGFGVIKNLGDLGRPSVSAKACESHQLVRLPCIAR